MRYILIVLLLAGALAEVQAQKFGFGAETGLTAGRFSDNQFRRRFTYHFAANTQTTLTPNVHLNLGVGYVRKGATTNVDGNILNTGTNFNLDYLELALLAGFGPENFQLRIGPTYSFLIQASFDGVVITDLINDQELGIKAGVFFKFWENESAYFSINYYQGLQDTNFDPEERLTTNYFQLSLGYLLLANR
ncbi:MAG: outer membrane beta-barrel protein [Bacteroidota bacterium]